MHFLRDLAGVLFNGLQIVLRDMSGRNDACGVAGVNACELNVLHDGGNIGVLTVADRVCLALHSVVEESVDQDRTVRCNADSREHVVFHRIIIIDDFHSTSAEDVRRTDHYGIADRIGNFCCFFNCCGHS